MVLEAEGKKQAMETEAEGLKNAEILKADARKESAIRDAEARERLAQAEANALKMVGSSITTGDPSTYLLGQKYVEGLMQLGKSGNSNYVVLPTDLINSIKSLFKG